ncbi:MAG TPA: 1-deoxy-D-xylulose-5-phosphate reductoisomerase [Gemmatimonadales bacterium]|nr:1-deoxy-D-xylulose-5-phosphate reductoisomerase [Gemmatimonadales bacterium]
MRRIESDTARRPGPATRERDRPATGPRGVAVLGSTGSIGRSTLAVLRRQREHFRVVALTAGSNEELLGEQVREFRPAYAGVVRGTNGSSDGPACLVEAATLPEADIVVNAVVGAAGLDATIAALRAGKRVALANKETLVMAGELVIAAAREGRGELVPIDSEHSAVLQCVTGREVGLERLILTASGGPFRGWPPERVWGATVEQALNHPTWRMGRKITVDSATLANKALELIEAHFLFGLPYDALEVVVHPQSIVHAFVQFHDGSVLAQLGFPTMELPILYALTHPDRLPDSGVRRFDPIAAGPLTFEPVRGEIFRAFRAGVEAARAGGTAPAVFNAANEEAVAAFLAGGVPFGRIAEVIERVLGDHRVAPASSLEAVREADRWARRRAREELR